MQGVNAEVFDARAPFFDERQGERSSSTSFQSERLESLAADLEEVVDRREFERRGEDRERLEVESMRRDSPFIFLFGENLVGNGTKSLTDFSLWFLLREPSVSRSTVLTDNL